jgi:flavodoxin
MLVVMQILLYSANNTESNSKKNIGGEQISNTKKILIAYYSHSGNTKEMAIQIQKVVGGDLFEIQTVKPYPSEYNVVTKQAKAEINKGYKPPIKSKVNNIAGYDIVFIGTPIWWGTMAPPVATFLSENNLSGKTIIPFCTHGSGGPSNFFIDTAKLLPQSIIVDGKGLNGSSVKTSQNEVSEWLNSIEIIKDVIKK